MPVSLPPVNGFGETTGCKANGFSAKMTKGVGELNDDEIGFLSMVVQMANEGVVSLPAGLDGGIVSGMLSHLNSGDPNATPIEKLSDLLRLLRQEGSATKPAAGAPAFDAKKPGLDKMSVSVLETVAGDGKDDTLKIVLANSASDEAEDGQLKFAPEPPGLKTAPANEITQDRDVRAQRPIDSSIMDQIGKAFVRNDNGRSEIRISLHPPELGHLRMSISTHDNHVTVKIIVEAPMVKEVIDNNLDQLRAELGNRGLEIENFDVSVFQDHTQNSQDPEAFFFADDDLGENTAHQDIPDIAQQNLNLKGKMGSDNGRVNYFA